MDEGDVMFGDDSYAAAAARAPSKRGRDRRGPSRSHSRQQRDAEQVQEGVQGGGVHIQGGQQQKQQHGQQQQGRKGREGSLDRSPSLVLRNGIYVPRMFSPPKVRAGARGGGGDPGRVKARNGLGVQLILHAWEMSYLDHLAQCCAEVRRAQ